MDWLKERIIKEGVVLSDQVLKLDALLTHQVDPALIMDMGREFAARFKESGVTKVVTLESSGISVALPRRLNWEFRWYSPGAKRARRSRRLCERVPSFTKGIVTDIMVSRQFIGEEDKLLFIDDIIANGDAQEA